MASEKKTLVCPNLKTTEDYAKQREKSKNDFEKFVEKRKAGVQTKTNGSIKK